MGALGTHFALTSDQERRLLAAAASDPDPDSRVEEVVQQIAHAWNRDWLQENDKAWDAIHRCLTDGNPPGRVVATASPHQLARYPDIDR